MHYQEGIHTDPDRVTVLSWRDETSIEDYSHHGEDAPHIWAAEQSVYDGEPDPDEFYEDRDW